MTLTLEQQLADDLLVRIEYRHDWSDVAFFPSGDGPQRSQPTLLLAAIWWFGNKAGPWLQASYSRRRLALVVLRVACAT